MSVRQYLDEAADRLESAEARIERVRSGPRTGKSHTEWLDALIEYAEALSELHRYTDASINEKLQALARYVQLEGYPWGIEESRPVD